jgi:hypothetical protein
MSYESPGKTFQKFFIAMVVSLVVLGGIIGAVLFGCSR